MKALSALLCAALAALWFGCSTTIEAPLTGTVLSKQYEATNVAILHGRVIARASFVAYGALIRLDAENGDMGRTYWCLCDKETWDTLVEGEQYEFTLAEGSIQTLDVATATAR